MRDYEELVRYLKSSLKRRKVVNLRRENIGAAPLEGVVLEMKHDFVLVSLLNRSGDFDGFSVFRENEITGLFWGEHCHKNIDPGTAREPGFDCLRGSWTEMLEVFQGERKVLAVHKEETSHSSYYLMRNYEVLGELLVFEYIDLDGFIGGAGAMMIDSISQIDFDIARMKKLSALTEL